MNAFLAALTCVALASTALPAGAADSPALPPRSAAELEEHVAPIALYPDPLVALILPASTRPTEVVLAMRFLDRGGNAELATRESWDDAVKALTRYREVLEYLDQNLAWTRTLGEAFIEQPEDVMAAIQNVRARARANGLLSDTREQAVYVDDGEIRIVPASPTLLYVPRYNPTILYTNSTLLPSYWLTFGVGYGVGAWLSYDCDWRYRAVRVVSRPPHWYHAPDWRPPPRRTYFTSSRWTPPPASLDRHPERPRRDFDRPRHVDRDLAPATPDRSGDRRWSERDRSRRSDSSPAATPPPLNAATVASTAPQGPTAPTVASTPPRGPTAPVIVATPPNFPPRTDRPRPAREDRDAERVNPRVNRPAPPDRAPRADATPTYSRPPRAERPEPAPTPRAAPSANRFEPARPSNSVPPRDDRPPRTEERHPTPDEREPR
jgi:hypothetical protein